MSQVCVSLAGLARGVQRHSTVMGRCAVSYMANRSHMVRGGVLAVCMPGASRHVHVYTYCTHAVLSGFFFITKPWTSFPGAG